MKPSNIGGQAVMEGIMMRHKDKYAVAVRRPDKEIELKVEDYKCTFGKASFLKKPIIRGVVSFVDGLVVGTKCLMYSAEIAGDEEDEEEAAKNAKLSEEELSAKKEKEAKQFQWLLYITVAISIVVSVAAFMLLPYALASLLRKVGASEFGVTVAEALVKLALFLGYMFLISRMKDIQRTFMYHGAEHKCINCVEHGMPLTVENVMASSRQHKRCGTSFLFLVMLVSICLHFVFVLVPVYWVRLFGRLLMVPVVAGISFEMIQWAGRTDSKLADFFSKPGLAMQKLTTKEPTPDMVEVAIKAVEAVFDWKQYLKDEFGWEPEEESKETHCKYIIRPYAYKHLIIRKPVSISNCAYKIQCCRIRIKSQCIGIHIAKHFSYSRRRRIWVFICIQFDHIRLIWLFSRSIRNNFADIVFPVCHILIPFHISAIVPIL